MQFSPNDNQSTLLAAWREKYLLLSPRYSCSTNAPSMHQANTSHSADIWVWAQISHHLPLAHSDLLCVTPNSTNASTQDPPFRSCTAGHFCKYFSNLKTLCTAAKMLNQHFENKATLDYYPGAAASSVSSIKAGQLNTYVFSQKSHTTLDINPECGIWEEH